MKLEIVLDTVSVQKHSFEEKNTLEKEIEEYLISYIFQRFNFDAKPEFDASLRKITINDVTIEIPEIPRKKIVLEKDLFNVKLPYYRYEEKIAITGTSKSFKLDYDLIGEAFDQLTLLYEKEGGVNASSELVFYPLLDMKIHIFYLQLKEFIPIKYKLLNNKDFLVGVSHDIDRTGDSYKYRMITYFFQTLKQKRPLLVFKGLFGKNGEANFSYIVEKEKEYDANSTWFILTRYGLKLNADYHLKDTEFTKALTLLKEHNREIGVHIPFMDLTVEEVRNEFLKIGQPEKMGMRMHHLRGEYEELMKILDEAKIPYDSTFGFNECMGYRFGTSVPFHPIIEGKILENIYEIPLNIMDLQITDSQKYRDQLNKLFTILQKVKGVCIINWHNNRFNKTKY